MALTPVSRLALESALTEPSAHTEIKGILDLNDRTVTVQSGTAAADLTATESDLVWVASTAQAGDIKLPQATTANTGMVIKVIAGADWSGTAFNLGFSNAGSTVLIGMLNVASNGSPTKDSVETFPVTASAKVLVMDSDDVTGAGGAKGSQYTFTYLAENLVHVEAHGKITTGTVAPDADSTLTTGWS